MFVLVDESGVQQMPPSRDLEAMTLACSEMNRVSMVDDYARDENGDPIPGKGGVAKKIKVQRKRFYLHRLDVIAGPGDEEITDNLEQACSMAQRALNGVNSLNGALAKQSEKPAPQITN